MRSRPRGRPTKCSAKVIADCERIQSIGGTDLITADYAGISISVFYEWLRKGERDPTSVYGHFAAAIKRGRSQSALFNLTAVENAVRKGTWQAAAWMLERRHKYRMMETVGAVDGLDVGIDIETEEGVAAALEILNQIPIEVLRKVDPRRLVAAIEYEEE